MAGLRELKSQILLDEVISDQEVETIRQNIRADGIVDLEDMKFLVELHCEAKTVCQAFKDLLHASLKEHVLADGEVSLSEQFHLLRTLYADGEIDGDERRFIEELKRDVKRSTPEFENFCEQVLAN